MRELYWNSFLCEFLIAIHWWRLSRKGQIRAPSTRAAVGRAALRTNFTIRSEKQFIWKLLHAMCLFLQSIALLSVETELCLIYSSWSFTSALVFLSLCLLAFMFGHILASFILSSKFWAQHLLSLVKKNELFLFHMAIPCPLRPNQCKERILFLVIWQKDVKWCLCWLQEGRRYLVKHEICWGKITPWKCSEIFEPAK